MGKRIVLEPGVYVVHFGSGTADAEPICRVVRAHTIVPMGVLSINVVDNTFVPFQAHMS